MDRTTGTALPPGIEDAELVASGGFASVYRAWQPDFHRQVAVKVLAADATDPEVRSRFEREVRAMGSLSDHPHVVPVYDAGIAGGRPYLVMPFLPGGSLADEPAPMPPDDVVLVGIAVADALDAAHRAGLLHRDVKPANILLTARAEPKLADFGVARFADATTTQGQIALTLAYAAPELLRGEPASVASDVYSLGATMHALLRGAPPFTVPADSSPMAMAMRVVSDDAPDLRSHGVPGWLVDVIERAMAKEPAQRFASAAALRDALEGRDDRTAALVATPATSVIDLRDETHAVPAAPPPPTPAPAPVRAEPGRSWWPMALVLLVVAGILLAAYLAATDGDDAPAAAPGNTTDTIDTTDSTVSTVSTDAPVETTATTAAPATTAPPTTQAPQSEPGDADADPVDAAREYFAVLDAGDIDAGWERLSPRYQNESGRDSYYGFWETIDSVEVLSAEPGDEPLTAVVELRYVRTDGSTTTETNTLRLVERQGGRLFVDGSS